MRIQGVTAETYSRVIVLPREGGTDWTFTIQPLPLGFHRRLRTRGVTPPSPPTRVARDSAGKALRDEQGQAVLAGDVQDAEYLADLELYHQRVAVLAVEEALRADAAVTFAARRPDEGAATHPRGESRSPWCVYADALYQELEEAGFTAGDLVLLCQEVCRLSNLTGEHLQKARGSFSSGAGARGP
jgi:hypothetical protein